MDNNAKLRPLYLAKILYERTDEGHYLTTMQLAQILEEKYGIPAHRQTIKTDIELLQQFGMDIQEVKSTQNRYNLISRQFEIAELKLLVDSVQSSKFISKERSEQMVSKIVTLAGQHKAEELKRNASVEGRTKSENRQDLLIVDAINEAINAEKKIAFQYFSYNVRKQKKLRHDGKIYLISPWALTWDDENYYMISYDSDENKIKHYRVDKMTKIQPTEEKRDGAEFFADFDMALYSKQTFGMYGGREETVTLRCENKLANVMIDKFGFDTAFSNITDTHFDMRVKVFVSPVFLTWIMNFGADVTVLSPESVKDELTALASDVLAQYK